MTGTGMVDADGAREVLARGAAAVLPNPAPLTYVVAATSPRAVNLAKGRPTNQAVALWAHHPRTVEALDKVLSLGAGLTTVAHRLLTDERVTLLAPLRPDSRLPQWLDPAAKDGWVLLFGAHWEPLLPVLTDSPVLYVSSANRTSHQPAATAAHARAMFPDAVPVLDADLLPGAELATPAAQRSATTTVRLHPDGTIDLHRNGAQDRQVGAASYLDHIRTAYQSVQPILGESLEAQEPLPRSCRDA